MKLKISVFLATLIMVAFCVGSCKKNVNEVTPVPAKQDVTFSFAQNGLKGAMLKAAAGKEDARYVVVSIENAAGTTVYDSKELSLYNFSGDFISQPLSLEVSGSPYKLTKFLVLDSSKNVIFATPIEGSALASFVADPLPIVFTVTKDQVTKVVPEVLSTQATPVGDFGYAAFDFNVVASSPLRFLTVAQIYNATTANWELTSANISVTGDGTLLYTGTIAAITDTVKVKDGYANYLVSVSKAGYATKDTTLTNAQLKTYLNSPLIFLLEVCHCNQETLTDIDGNVYKTVTIGTQTWMAENLKVTHYRNGDPITYVTDNGVWAAQNDVFAGYGAYCWPNGDMANKDVYGALYNGYTVFDSRNIAPVGWHVPSLDEWKTIINYLGGESVAGGKLKETGTLHWTIPNTDATNKTCFSALPGGSRTKDTGTYTNFGTMGNYHTSTEENNSGFPNIWSAGIFYDKANANTWFAKKAYGSSIRLIKD